MTFKEEEFNGKFNNAVRRLRSTGGEGIESRTEIDAPKEPNAVRGRQSAALDEGLTERIATDDFRVFAQRCGYEGLTLDGHQYEGAVEAVDRLVDYAAGPDRQDR